MLKQIDITECHRQLLHIAIAFDKLCQKHHIPYYMLGGTMLGSIRHQGFIPWDDDMDFGIPRPFFQKFISIAKEELPASLELIGRNDSEAMKKGFVKMQLKGSKLFEKVFGEQKEGFYNGIAIDIFPLDGADSESFFGKLHSRIAFLLERIHEGKFCTLSIRKGGKKWVAALIKALPFRERDLADFIDQWIQKPDYSTSKQVSNYYGHWKEREIMDKSILGEPVYYPFESIRLLGAERYDDYLKSLYGDYMKLPPVDQQITHADEMYIDV